MSAAAEQTAISENRITVSLTWRQKAYLNKEAHKRGIGVSEYLRRMLDEVIDQPGASPNGVAQLAKTRV